MSTANKYLEKIIPFKYDTDLLADENYKLFGECVNNLNKNQDKIADFVYECGELL